MSTSRLRVVAVADLVLLLAAVSATRASEAAQAALGATFRILDRQTSATCFLVRPPQGSAGGETDLILVTAAHFLEGTADADCVLVLRTRGPDQTCARKEVPVPVRAEGAPRWRRHPELDIAVLPVQVPADCAVTPFRFEQLADAASVARGDVRVGQSVMIPCFPVKLEANAAGWPVLRKGAIATYPLAPVEAARTILVDVNTFGGDSGAPVVVAGRRGPLVAGVVVGMQRQTDRSSLPFEEKTVHMPLGLAIVTQAAFVRETIEALSP